MTRGFWPASIATAVALACAVAARAETVRARDFVAAVRAGTPSAGEPAVALQAGIVRRGETAVPAQAGAALARELALAAPDIDPAVLALATTALHCASTAAPSPVPQRLAVVDYSRASTRVRLWVFDLATQRLLHAERVAHGRGSGEDFATKFSNDSGSHRSSLGLFRTAETYVGQNGYSLRMDGLEAGINDRARDRAIVMHGADYVSDASVRALGRLGRSWGCPAVRREAARGIIDDLKDGQYLFVYYPDAAWLKGSRFLGCAASGAAGRAAP